MREVANVGRPPKYRDVEEIEDKIEYYFKSCEGEPLLDDEGKPVVNKYGYPCWIKAPKPPTVTGLALALGFTNRLSLLNYQGKKEFINTITRAKSRVEEYAESRLFDREGSNGAQFSLRNNFKGWNDTEEKRLENESEKLKLEKRKVESQLVDDSEDKFTERLKDMATLADILKKPVSNRDIEDFE